MRVPNHKEASAFLDATGRRLVAPTTKEKRWRISNKGCRDYQSFDTFLEAWAHVQKDAAIALNAAEAARTFKKIYTSGGSSLRKRMDESVAKFHTSKRHASTLARALKAAGFHPCRADSLPKNWRQRYTRLHQSDLGTAGLAYRLSVELERFGKIA